MGTVTTGLVGMGVLGTTVSADHFETATVEELSDDDPEMIASNIFTWNEHASGDSIAECTIQWFYSQYSGGEWSHSWAICANSGIASIGDHAAHEYEVTEPDGDLYVNTSDDIGVLGGDGTVPSWTVPLIEQGISSAVPGFGWVYAGANAIKEAYGYGSGYDLGGGYEFSESSIWGLGDEVGHFARFIYKSNQTGPMSKVSFGYTSGHLPPGFETLEINVAIQDPNDYDPPGCSPSGACPVAEQPKSQLKEPREMTADEIEAFGIKQIDMSEYQSLEDNEETRDRIPEFIATKTPLVITDVNETSTRQS